MSRGTTDRWICLDVGETLIDETRVWLEWARLLDVTPFTMLAAIGAVGVRTYEHQTVFQVIGRPDWRELLPAFHEAYEGFRAEDLYPDVRGSLAALKKAGYRLAIVANQPAERTAELRVLGIRTEVMAMSAEMNLSKPDPAFFQRALELMGNPDPANVAYVGDRLDNDVRPAIAAGMRAVWLRRGPWGTIGDSLGPPVETALIVDTLADLVDRLDEVWPAHPDAEADSVPVPEREPAATLQLVVIGSAAAWSLQSGRPSSSYLLESGDDALVLDLGQGSMSHLAERRPLDSISAVVVSHLHPDHHVDLVALRHYLKFGLGRPSDVHLYAPPELRARYDSFLGQEGFLDSLPGDDVRAGSWTVGPFAIQAAPVTHAPHAFAFRVSLAADPDLPGLVYSGDCGRWQDLLPLIGAGDTLLCEAFWGVISAEAEEMHLPAVDAARAARDGGAARLILTHIADSQDPEACRREAATVFDGPIDIARPGLSLRIG